MKLCVSNILTGFTGLTPVKQKTMIVSQGEHDFFRLPVRARRQAKDAKFLPEPGADRKRTAGFGSGKDAHFQVMFLILPTCEVWDVVSMLSNCF